MPETKTTSAPSSRLTDESAPDPAGAIALSPDKASEAMDCVWHLAQVLGGSHPGYPLCERIFIILQEERI